MGKTSVRLERPDLVHLVIHGPNKAEYIAEVQKLLFEIGDMSGPFDLLVGLGELGSFEVNARRVWTRAERPYPFRHAFVYQASFAIRTLVLTTHRAGRFIAPAAFRWDVDFFPTEAAARARIESLHGSVVRPTA